MITNINIYGHNLNNIYQIIVAVDFVIVCVFGGGGNNLTILGTAFNLLQTPFLGRKKLTT